MPFQRTYQVKEVATLSGVSIRALHHYEAIALLVPSGRTQAGYRLYNDRDLLRLQQIVIGRELGLSLEAIRRSLDNPHFNHRQALLAQRAELAARAERAGEMLRAVDAALAATGETSMETKGTAVDLKKIFDGFDPEQHASEAQQRWGNSEAYKVSARSTKSYTQADWQRMRDELAAICADAFAALTAGVAADEPHAMDVAERHRQSIERWFYPCNTKMHCGLADLWEADPRFAENIDRHGAGLTTFLAAAVRANALRAAE